MYFLLAFLTHEGIVAENNKVCGLFPAQIKARQKISKNLT